MHNSKRKYGDDHYAHQNRNVVKRHVHSQTLDLMIAKAGMKKILLTGDVYHTIE
jgi:hypothetical protein